MAPTPSEDSSNATSTDEIMKQISKVLEDLKKDGKIVRLRICPKCKSPNIRSHETWYDIGGAMGITPPKYRCLQCGYWGRVILEVTNVDFDERILDELNRVDVQSAQKLLNDINQQATTEDQ